MRVLFALQEQTDVIIDAKGTRCIGVISVGL